MVLRKIIRIAFLRTLSKSYSKETLTSNNYTVIETQEA